MLGQSLAWQRPGTLPALEASIRAGCWGWGVLCSLPSTTCPQHTLPSSQRQPAAGDDAFRPHLFVEDRSVVHRECPPLREPSCPPSPTPPKPPSFWVLPLPLEPLLLPLPPRDGMIKVHHHPTSPNSNLDSHADPEEPGMPLVVKVPC